MRTPTPKQTARLRTIADNCTGFYPDNSRFYNEQTLNLSDITPLVNNEWVEAARAEGRTDYNLTCEGHEALEYGEALAVIESFGISEETRPRTHVARRPRGLNAITRRPSPCGWNLVCFECYAHRKTLNVAEASVVWSTNESGPKARREADRMWAVHLAGHITEQRAAATMKEAP